MRTLLLLLSVLVSAGFAQAASDVPAIDEATMKAIVALATRGYAEPGKAEIKNVHLSKAKNGKGYCGEVTIEGKGEFTVFHVILGEGSDATVIRLSDYPAKTGNNYAETVARMMHNFGCTE
jgi:hypothetical protein